MALRADVRYVQYGVDGTAARKVQKQPTPEVVKPRYEHRKTEKKVIAVDPVALAGIVLSVVVLIALLVGLVRYRQSLNMRNEMHAYVQQLEQENAELEQVYRDGYDLEQIRDIALSAGMIPAENVERMSVEVEEPRQETPRLGFWDSIATFLAGIFA